MLVADRHPYPARRKPDAIRHSTLSLSMQRTEWRRSRVKRVMARRMKYDLIAPDEVGYVPLADAAISFRAIFRSCSAIA